MAGLPLNTTIDSPLIPFSRWLPPQLSEFYTDMTKELPNPDESRGALSAEDQLRFEKAGYFWEMSLDRLPREFQSLLNETSFISRILEIYRRDALRRFRIGKHYLGSKQPFGEFEEEQARVENFVNKYLPQRLFDSVDVLMIEASFMRSGEPMRKAQLAKLIDIMFVHRIPGDPPLKDGRNEVWNAANLKSALNRVLPKIKVPGAVTLSVVAKKINKLPKTGSLQSGKKPLSAKHLQKLFREHDVNWMHVKRDHIKRLTGNGAS